MGWICAGSLGFAVVCTAGFAHAGRPVGPALDAAVLGSVCIGHAGAVHIGGPFLQSWLACAQGIHRQYGSAGVFGHHGRMAVVGVVVAYRTRRSHATPVL